MKATLCYVFTALVVMVARAHAQQHSTLYSSCKRRVKGQCSQAALNYRTIDGSCNNLAHPSWGKSFTQPKRLLPSEYTDGIGAPRTHSVDGSDLKSAREISAHLRTDVTTHNSRLTILHMAFGQYIDHDITHFPVIKVNGSAPKCCVPGLNETMMVEHGGPCFPVHIPYEDMFFRGRNCMEFVRSKPMVDGQGVVLEPREQINMITPYIDASTVYGSTSTFTDAHLDVNTGLLRVGPNNMLPVNTKQNCVIVDTNSSTDYCMAAGDGRANVFLGLGMFHTVFHRLHNDLVHRLKRVNPSWGGRTLFNEARKIVSAIHQHISFKEYLPAFLSPDIIDRYGLQEGSYQGYDESVNAQMSNAVSTAAFRYGHSQIQGEVNVGNMTFPMQDTLKRPHLLLKHGVDTIFNGMCQEPADDPDHHFSNAITNHMFEVDPAQKDGLDLVSVNTQRGRDHGLPPYNKYRELCGLQPLRNFSEGCDLVEANKLAQVYSHVDDIDLFIGGMTEVHMQGGLTGPTFACIIGQQFKDLKYGDRFWYERSQSEQMHGEAFSSAQLAEIKKQSMASIVCQSTSIRTIQERAMEMPDDVTNPETLCRLFPRINLDVWKV